MTQSGHPPQDRVFDYADVTEVPGIGADQEQLQRAADRYGFAASYCAGKRVLEVACGAGLGLGMLAQFASSTVGGDLTPALIQTAHRQYAGRLELLLLDAQHLPFGDGSFDVIVLFEALYYLPDFVGFLDECQRVLSPGGALILSTVNKGWSDFNPSPFSTKYYSAEELVATLQRHGYRTTVFADSKVQRGSALGLVVSWMKRTAVKLNLMPKSMKAKQLLRRIFMGRLEPLPVELLPGAIAATEPTPIDLGSGSITEYKIIFVYAEAVPA